MFFDGKHYRTIWLKADDSACVQIIDQRVLPHEFVIEDLHTIDDAITAIRDMHVRGAPLIGATAAWGLYLSIIQQEDRFSFEQLKHDGERTKAARPTAINLSWAVDRMMAKLESATSEFAAMAKSEAEAICLEDVEICRKIGVYGLPIIEDISRRKNGAAVNILTHCNAGWLATVDWGTATSPIYHAQQAGIAVHVWVDETRPRNQGSSLTAWELSQQGIDHTVIVDNAGGHLMQNGEVDLVIVGTDRTVRNGDVANKIGTYLKALAAFDNEVPFYVALPSSTIDWELTSGKQIPIEQRSADEVTHISGDIVSGGMGSVRLTPVSSPAANPAFDVTPARLVTGLITERGICPASELGLLSLFPEMAEQEGVIKYNLRFSESDSLLDHDYTDLSHWHQQFKAANILGQDLCRYDGLGFGNLSERLEQQSFLISGTQTGGLDRLTVDDYARVTHADITQNLIESEGRVKPSSESLTHAAIYALDNRINFVFHVHSPEIWQARDKLGIPQTDASIAYGTADMACEMQRLYDAGAFVDGNILAMVGHEDGIIGFGSNAAEAGEVIMRYLRIT